MLLDNMFGTSIGIEFRDDAIVFCCLKNSVSGISLISSSTFPLRGKETDYNEIKSYLGKHGSDISKVFVSVPDKWAITKFAEVPSMKGKSRDALSNLMKFEVERHVPFQLEDIDHDFLVMEEKDKLCSVVFVVIQKERVNFVKEILGKFSLKPDAITTSSFAVLNTIELGGGTAGGWQEIVGIVRKSKIWGKKNESNISLYMSRKRADLAIIKDGFCMNLRTFAVISEGPEQFLEKLKKHLSDIQSVYNIDSFRKIMVSGDISSIPDLKGKLEENIRENMIAAEEVTFFSDKLMGSEINGLVSSIGACFAGLGIGTYVINMLPHKGVYAVKKIAPHTTKLFLVLILVLIIASFTVEVVKKKEVMTRVEQSLKENMPEIEEIETMSLRIKALKKQSDFLQIIQDNEITLELLAELSIVLPGDAWITNLNYKRNSLKGKNKSGEEIVINGYADSSSNLIPLLEDSIFFDKVEFVGPIKKTRDKEQFKLSARVVNPDKSID